MCAIIPCPMIFPRNALACVSVQMYDTPTRYARVLQVVDQITQGELSGFAWPAGCQLSESLARSQLNSV